MPVRLGRRASPAAIVLLLLLVLTGCGIGGQARAQSPIVLHWANEQTTDLLTLDPAGGGDYNSRQAIQLIFGGLVRFGPGFQVLPDAASRWEVSPDGRTYTFHLRPNLRFGDGTPVGADDVVYSLTRALSPELAAQSGATYLLGDILGAKEVMSGAMSGVVGLQVLDTHTLRIRLNGPSGSFLAKLANPAGYIVPRSKIEADPKHWYEHAMGTGPFMVDRWVHNNALLLVPNSYYYAGKPQIAGIDMPFIPEPLTAYKRYRAGSIDLMGSIEFPTSALYDVAGRSDFHRQAELRTMFLTLNERRPPFNDVRVRLAFAHALDKTALVHEVFSDFAHPTDGMMPPGLPGYNPHLRGAGHDPALARALLAKAGYPGGRGLPTINYPVDEGAQNIVLATAIAEQWREVLGAHVRIVQHAHSSYVQLLTNLNYQAAAIDWTADYPDPQNFVSQQLHSNVPNNNGGYSNPTFDRLVDRADRMVNSDRRRIPLYRRAEELAMSQAATIPLVNPLAGIMLRSDVRGIQISGGRVLASDWARVRVVSGGQR